MNSPFAIPECRVAHLVERHDDHRVVPVRPDAATGCCPECGHASRSVHRRDHRHPSDLPLSTSQTRLRIEVRRFYCRNPTCRRRTFAETPTDLLAPHARRTRRLGEAQARVGLACGGAGGARLLTHLHMPVDMPASRATVLRLVTRIPMPDAPAPIRVGIDDWAIRKGSRYGTIVVDLDRHRVIDLLPDPTAPTVAGWLERHPGAATRRPGSLDRVCPRRKPRHSPGATGRRSPAPARHHAAGRRTSHGVAARLKARSKRLKLIKRQCYGRAGLDLLKRRMVLAA